MRGSTVANGRGKARFLPQVTLVGSRWWPVKPRVQLAIMIWTESPLEGGTERAAGSDLKNTKEKKEEKQQSANSQLFHDTSFSEDDTKILSAMGTKCKAESQGRFRRFNRRATFEKS